MKTWKVVVTAVVFSLGVGACLPPQLIIKDRSDRNETWDVVVFPFKDAAGVPGSGAKISDLFSGKLLRLAQYNIIEKGLVESQLRSAGLAEEGLDVEKALLLGEDLGADAILLGEVIAFQNRKRWLFPPAKVAVSARLVEVKTGHLVWSANHRRDYGRAHWVVTLIPFPPTMVLSALYSPSAQNRAEQAVANIVKSLDKRFREAREPH